MKRNSFMTISFGGLLLFSTWFIASPVHATTALSMSSIDQLTRQSDEIVHGTVESIESYMENDQIFTEVDIRVIEYLKGKTSDKIVTLKLYGGTANGLRTRVIGAPCLSPREEVVLFLKDIGNGKFCILNLAEGKFSVQTGADKVKRVVRDVSGIHYLHDVNQIIPKSLEELKAAVAAVQ